jgi:hypothetical protein
VQPGPMPRFSSDGSCQDCTSPAGEMHAVTGASSASAHRKIACQASLIRTTMRHPRPRQRGCMRQLVGLECAICAERIDSIVEGQFCASCECPVHLKCVRSGKLGDQGSACPACGALPDKIRREQTLHQQDEQQRKAESSGRHRLAYLAGIVGFSIITIQGLISTLNPKADGRLLNTAPSIGVDLFLFVGLLGIGFCIVQLIRSAK